MNKKLTFGDKNPNLILNDNYNNITSLQWNRTADRWVERRNIFFYRSEGKALKGERKTFHTRLDFWKGTQGNIDTKIKLHNFLFVLGSIIEPGQVDSHLAPLILSVTLASNSF